MHCFTLDSDPVEKLRCWFSADDSIDAVYFNGVEITNTIPDITFAANTAKNVILDVVPGAVLAFACHDRQNGGGAGFFLYCKAEGESKWEFALKEGTREGKVFAGDTQDSVPSGWARNGFNDASWAAPERNTGKMSA